MITFLVDHNIVGHARTLFRTVAAQGWLELLPMRLVLLADVGLTRRSKDREIWLACQATQMVLLTANRSEDDPDSLEAVLRNEGTGESLPVVTISDSDRLLRDPAYRDACASRLVEIALYLDTYRGAGRIYIP